MENKVTKNNIAEGKVAVAEPKLTYGEPKLIVYGSIATITQSMMMAGSDGAAGMDNFST